MTKVFLCVIRNEMLVFKKYVGESATSDSIRTLLGTADLVPIDSWSEIDLTYEKYDSGDLKRVWSKIVKSAGGLEDLSNLPDEGSWGILYES